jgi:hypothetical protein
VYSSRLPFNNGASSTLGGWRAFALAFVCLSGATPFPALSQDTPVLSDSAYISVLTILPGDPLYSAFGHTAIRVRDDSLGIDAVYNFGTFDFDTDWFYLKFARGLLDYRLARNLFGDVYLAYSEEGRPIIEQRLNLDEQERQLAVVKLEHNYLPENRFYRYDFFFDNCSTRPRDLIELLLGNAELRVDVADRQTFRELIKPYIAPTPWTHFIIDVLLGSGADEVAGPRERLFLPDELMVSMETVYHERAVVADTDTLFWPIGYERGHQSGVFGPMFVFGVLLVLGLAVVFAPARDHRYLRNFDATLFFFAGLVGVAILFLWFLSEHSVTQDNWNILWAFPIHVVAAAALVRDGERLWLRWYFVMAAVGAACLLAVLPLVNQGFHPAVIPLCLLIMVRAGFRVRSFSA